MSKVLLLVLLLGCFSLTNTVYGQNAQAKTDELITALGKTKYKKKDKKNISNNRYFTSVSKSAISVSKTKVRELSESLHFLTGDKTHGFAQNFGRPALATFAGKSIENEP